jgi:hypothetical protein
MRRLLAMMALCAACGGSSATAVPANAPRQCGVGSPGAGAIEGRVTNFGGDVIGNVAVVARSSVPSLPASDHTDSTGRFMLMDLRPGEYEIVFTLSETRVERVEVRVTACTVTRVRVRMTTSGGFFPLTVRSDLPPR